MKKTQIVRFVMPKLSPEQIEVKADNFLPPLSIVFNEWQSKLWPEQKNHITRSNLTLFSKKKTHCHILDAKLSPKEIEIKSD